MYFFYFYPLGLDRRLTRRPGLTWSLTALMLVGFVWLRYLPDHGPLDPWDLVFFPGDGPPWSVATAIFMHASWLHLLGNLVYLMVFGPPLEDRLGPWKFGFYFLLLGNFGNLVHGGVSVLDLLGQGGLGVMGASGALAGLLSFSLVRFRDARVEVAWWVLAPLAGQNKAGKTRIPLAAAVGLWLLLQVVQAAVSTETGARVSFGAHLGGFAMGLALALALGEWKAGKAEAAREQARRYFQAGHFHAAAGSFSEYLTFEPGDEEVQLELARTLRAVEQHGQALTILQRIFRRRLAAGLADEALAVWDEGHRGTMTLELTATEMARVAILKEKKLDFTGALDAYRRLYETFPAHPEGQRALVRVIVLCHGKVGDPESARLWLQQAWRYLPEGSWRDYLEREFNLSEASCAVAAPTRD